MPNRQHPPFFIVACARSGTTLLRTMLDRHPELVITPESHFITDLWKRRRRYGPGDRVVRLDVFLQDLRANRRFRLWDLPAEALDEEIRRLERTPPTFAEAVLVPFEAYARWKGKPRWGDKTPAYVETIPLLARLFPDARFVHVIRDGREVALSMMDLDRLHRGAGSPALVWGRRVQRGRADGRALGPERYAELRYEHLLDDPEAALRSICRFLDLSFDRAMLEHREGASRMLPDEVRWMHRRLDLPPTKGLRDWRSQMTREQAARFEAVAGATLAAFGYPAGPPPGPTDRAAAWREVAAFAARVLRRKIRRAAGPWGRRTGPRLRTAGGRP